MDTYRVAAGHRYTPCNGRKYIVPQTGRTKHCPGTGIRVKIAEPGVYVRSCERCGNIYWFLLEPSVVPNMTDVLMLKWITAAQAAAWVAASQIDGPDLADLVDGEV